MEAVFTMLKPTSPPKVDGFHHLGLQIGLLIKPLTLQGPPTFTNVNAVSDGPGFSDNKPEKKTKVTFLLLNSTIILSTTIIYLQERKIYLNFDIFSSSVKCPLN